jgi:hypothetical protein
LLLNSEVAGILRSVTPEITQWLIASLMGGGRKTDEDRQSSLRRDVEINAASNDRPGCTAQKYSNLGVDGRPSVTQHGR